MLIFKYDNSKYNFEEELQGLFGVDDLSSVHLLDEKLTTSEKLTQQNEAETFFHKKFYSKLKNWPSFMKMYDDFIENEASKHFSEDFLCQRAPSFRVQVPNQTAVSKWHYDNDKDHGHPEWEINFQVAITDAFGTNCTWIESVPGLKDFKPIELKKNEYAIFDGNRCTHGNKYNETGMSRISFDFRVLPLNRFDSLNKKISFYGKEFSPEGYYRLIKKKV